MRDDALFVEVLMALGQSEFVEQVLVHEQKKYRERMTILGAIEGRRTYINPRAVTKKADVVSTLIHEGIHRARSCWKERSVLIAERRLFARLNDEQADAIYKVYGLAVRRLRGVREL